LKFIFLFFLLIFKNLGAFEYKNLKTNSGIEFWFVEDKSIPIVSVSFSFKGGSSIDTKNKNGISNLMTSLLDEGTRNLTSKQFKNEMKMKGMKLSFSTQKDKIDGVFQIISSQAKQGFDLFYEAVNHPSFNDADIERVKRQVISSIKIDESNLSTLASNKFNQNFFKDHVFSKNIKGSESSLKNITKLDLVDHHKKSLVRNNLIIGVAGNINVNQIKKYIELVFGELEENQQIYSIQKFNSLSVGEKIFEMKTPQSSVLFGHPGLERNNENFFALRIANYILGGGGFQSRLYKNIREKKGLVYSIYSYLLSYENDGVIVGGFQTRNISVFETINNVKNEWKKIHSRGITKIELDNAKAYFNGSFTRNFTSTLSIARLLQVVQYYELGADYFIKREKIINSLNLELVNKVISDYFSNDKLFFMIVGEPEKK
tara:strand:+ start:394 stop:1683 length:1290 start_codon:yes stop_codon:yes gene_type:complete